MTTKPGNRLQLDYAAEALRMTLDRPIIDAHTHITGGRAADLYGRVARMFGIKLTYSMTPLARVSEVREQIGMPVRFIAMPTPDSDNLRHEVTDGFIEQIESLHGQGERIVKIWAAPRGRDLGDQAGFPTAFRIDAPHNQQAMQLATKLGMAIMVHVADPDTWFATKYSDASRYGSKRDQYIPFEQALGDFDTPFIAAHMGGWPENLSFLSELLERHNNLHLDTSATKWVVRELSKYDGGELIEFLTQWRGRILFGSDIVASNQHFGESSCGDPPVAVVQGEQSDIFDLYASRYWALRTMLETSYRGESPIADPDLALVAADKYTELDAPMLFGHALPTDLLQSLYYGAATELLEPLYCGVTV